MENEPKEKKTELWATLVTTLMLLVSNYMGHPVDPATAAAVVVPVVSYTFGRSYVKGSKLSVRNLKSLALEVAAATMVKPVNAKKLNQ